MFTNQEGRNQTTNLKENKENKKFGLQSVKMKKKKSKE